MRGREVGSDPSRAVRARQLEHGVWARQGAGRNLRERTEPRGDISLSFGPSLRLPWFVNPEARPL